MSETVDPWDYDVLRDAIAGRTLPLAIVDLPSLEANADRMRGQVESHGKSLRVASKSLRAPDLLRLVLDRGRPCFQGLLCYSAAEARFLFEQGFDNLVVAYPAVQEEDVAHYAAARRQGATIVATVDCVEHVERLEAMWSRAETKGYDLAVSIDADVALRPLGPRRGPHLGVRRSPIRDTAAFRQVLVRIERAKGLRLGGIMAYEAQVAGLEDRSRTRSWFMDLGIRAVKRLSVGSVSKRRRELCAILDERGHRGVFVNGGGSGSLTTTSLEPWVTEVAAGSGFLQSHLFDGYRACSNRPAFCFALPVTRLPEPGIATCQSGGFIASGACSKDRAPLPFRPSGLQPIPAEGFGEVQTPLLVPRGRKLRIGDPVFFRPAKAGEIAEFFEVYLLKRGAEIVGEARTYRGLGKRFF